MKILIDECLPVELKGTLDTLGHECETVRRAGYGSKKNGELLALADRQWDVLLTSDRNIKYQQNITGRNVSREIESHEGSVAAHARLCQGTIPHSGRRSRATVAR
jgi:predicted nuclease of predicted toxin-antitoxin system